MEISQAESSTGYNVVPGESKKEMRNRLKNFFAPTAYTVDEMASFVLSEGERQASDDSNVEYEGFVYATAVVDKLNVLFNEFRLRNGIELITIDTENHSDSAASEENNDINTTEDVTPKEIEVSKVIHTPPKDGVATCSCFDYFSTKKYVIYE